MNHTQKANSITLWLVNKSKLINNADVMRMNMFALDFVGSGVTTPQQLRRIPSYDQLPFIIDNKVCMMLINHPCEPTLK